jgi:hypothetical protein
MDVFEQSTDITVARDRRAATERRCGSRRTTSLNPTENGGVERRTADRRAGERRNVPSLVCPDCGAPLRQERALSWSLPHIYTVDVGFCPSCMHRFLRDRDTGDYDLFAW